MSLNYIGKMTKIKSILEFIRLVFSGYSSMYSVIYLQNNKDNLFRVEIYNNFKDAQRRAYEILKSGISLDVKINLEVSKIKNITSISHAKSC